MKRMKLKKKISISKILLTGVIFITLVIAAYIMVNHMGLIDGLDFGAGAYYYADMPGFEKLVDGSHYTSQTPMWVLILLFLAWGAVMYRLWSWIERKTGKGRRA